ncbi:unnamed protein product [Fraxinus pennsylvanica]|uniref:Uncharacterized protein n=1 Tax=Fraxinus pennsylvanica TaxID=56036 RepID=A0AAD2DL94_9LAMI|nr:unnamed protein product [Fraxinus pennsylvanica]
MLLDPRCSLKKKKKKQKRITFSQSGLSSGCLSGGVEVVVAVAEVEVVVEAEEWAVGKEVVSTCTPKEELSHWLREAVDAPGKTPELDLPSTLSTIAQSVRILYGEESSKIPPFIDPGLPPPLPQDPRCSLKKTKKKKKKRITFSQSGLSKPAFPLHPNSSDGVSGFPRIEPNFNIASLNPKMTSLSSSSGTTTIKKENNVEVVASGGWRGQYCGGNTIRTLFQHDSSYYKRNTEFPPETDPWGVIFSQSYVERDPDDPTSIAAFASVSRKVLLTTERK